MSSNRAAKDIDFGFGTVFGAPKILSPGAPAHASQPESTIPRTRRSSSRKTPTPDRRRITSSPLPRQTPTGTQNKSSSRSTPESGRNTRPQRISIFDIPPDDGADQGREHKRRRIGKLFVGFKRIFVTFDVLLIIQSNTQCLLSRFQKIL